MFVELLKAWRMCFLCRDFTLDVGNKINLTFTFLHIMRLSNERGKSILNIVIGFVENAKLSKYAERHKLYDCQTTFTIINTNGAHFWNYVQST